MPTRLFVCAFATLLAGAFARPAEAQFSVPTPSVEDYHVELGTMWWKPAPILVIRNGSGGTDVNVVEAFGIEDTRFKEFRLVLKPGRKHKIRGQYVPLKYAKDASINREFTFGGHTYTVNAPASVAFDWTLWRFGYEWDFVSNKNAFVGAIGEVKYTQVKATISSAALGVSSSADVKAPLPAVGAIARGYLTKGLSITVEATGFKVPDRFNVKGRFLDYDLYGMANLGRNVSLQAGYRKLDMRYDVDDVAGQMKMGGRYFGLSVRF